MELFPENRPVDYFLVRIENDVVGPVNVDAIVDDNAIQQIQIDEMDEDVTVHRVPRTETNINIHQFLNQAIERQKTDASDDWTAWIQSNPDAVALIQNNGSRLLDMAILRRLHWTSWPFMHALLSLCVERK